MANKAVTLMRRCKTPAGWRFYPVVIGKTGKVKPRAVLVGEVEVVYPTGYYVLRSFVGGRTVFTKAGDNAADALAAFNKAASLVELKEKAPVAGVQLVEEAGRKNLQTEFKKFLQATKDRGSTEAAEVYALSGKEFLQVIGRTYADEIEPDDMIRFHKALRKRGLSNRTISNRHKNVLAFLLYLSLDTKRMPRAPRYEKTVPKVYEREDLTAFFSSLDNLKDQFLFNVFLQTGVREQEAMHLELADFSVSTKTLKLRGKPRYGFTMKDFEQRDLPLSEELVEQLERFRVEYPEQSPLIFGRDERGGKPGIKPDGHMLRTLKRLVRKAGLNCGSCEGCLSKTRECSEWYLHRFRANYCTSLSRAGLDLPTTQRMMGHADLESTMRYLRPAEGVAVQAAVNSIQWK